MGEKTKNVYERRFINMVRVMERFHWDYLTYMEQPSFVITNLLNYLSAETEFNLSKTENG